MSMESDLQAALEACCPSVYPVAADPMPTGSFITWQLIGGNPWRYMDNQAADQRHSLVQVNVWASTLAAALTLVRTVEEALAASSAFTAAPQAEPTDMSEPELQRWGFAQDYEITAAR